MSWLKRIEPTVISQASEVPYVVLEDGVYLCFDNLYGTNSDQTDYYIKFKVAKNDLSQQSTNYFYLKSFPYLVPFEDVIILDDAIAEGRIIKSASQTEKSRSILVAKSSYLHNFEDGEFQEFVETIDEFDNAFLLTGEEIEPQDRLLQEIMHVTPHSDWYKTCVSILNQSIPHKNRKYCWTKLSGLHLTMYGSEDGDECRQISDCLDHIGISEKEIIWA